MRLHVFNMAVVRNGDTLIINVCGWDEDGEGGPGLIRPLSHMLAQIYVQLQIRWMGYTQWVVWKLDTAVGMLEVVAGVVLFSSATSIRVPYVAAQTLRNNILAMFSDCRCIPAER